MDIGDLLQLTARKPLIYAVDERWSGLSPVGINGLPIPRHILQLISSGRWKDKRFAKFPHCDFTERTELCLFDIYGMASVNLYWEFETSSEFLGDDNSIHTCGKINPKLSVLIGDFGLGSDQPIALDYRSSVENPRVVGLFRGQPQSRRYWTEITESIEDFTALIEL